MMCYSQKGHETIQENLRKLDALRHTLSDVVRQNAFPINGGKLGYDPDEPVLYHYLKIVYPTSVFNLSATVKASFASDSWLLLAVKS